MEHDLVDSIRRFHREDPEEGWCIRDKEDWPCCAVRGADELEQVRKLVESARLNFSGYHAKCGYQRCDSMQDYADEWLRELAAAPESIPKKRGQAGTVKRKHWV